MKILHAFAAGFLALTPTAACLAQALEKQALEKQALEKQALEKQALEKQALAKQACNVDVDITDADPKGTHVRSTPCGAVIATLRNPNVEGWIGIHITGQFGDWYEIDRANLINADLGPDGKIIFHGNGYLHRSVLGVSGMQNGGAIFSDHELNSSPIDLHARGDQKVDLLGCWGEFLKVHVKKGTGWTKAACTNMDTTCA